MQHLVFRCVCVCISICAHLYIIFSIHELLIYLRLQSFISGFETSLWIVTDGFSLVTHGYTINFLKGVITCSMSTRYGAYTASNNAL